MGRRIYLEFKDFKNEFVFGVWSLCFVSFWFSDIVLLFISGLRIFGFVFIFF